MTKKAHDPLSRRERQVMDLAFARRVVSVGDVVSALPDPPSYSAVRATMNNLVEKGHLRTKPDGRKLLYLPTRTRRRASLDAARRMLGTFFDGSVHRAVEGMIEAGDRRLSDEELDALQGLVDRLREEKDQ